jgi:hypothetical protein
VEEKRKLLPVQGARDVQEIDISNIVQGIYTLLLITRDGKTFSKQFIKIK